MRTTRPALALALALAASAAPVAGASGRTAAPAATTGTAPLLCPAEVPSTEQPGTTLSNPSTTVEKGTSNATYGATTTTLPAPQPTEKAKKKDPAPQPETVTSGVFTTQFTLEDATCTDATYSITVSSSDGSALGWQLTRTTSSDASDQRTDVTASSTGPADGSSVTVTFTGDGAAHGFALSGTTDAYEGGCVLSTLRIAGPGGDVRFSKGLEVCDDLPGGTSYR